MKKNLSILFLVFILVGCGLNQTTTEDTRYQALEERISELENQNHYTQSQVDDMLSDYVTNEYLWRDFYNLYGEEVLTQVEEMIKEYEPDRTIEQIDYEITITTIAQLDIILYSYENHDEPLTEEEQFAYNIYSFMRNEMYEELTEEETE